MDYDISIILRNKAIKFYYISMKTKTSSKFVYALYVKPLALTP